jgi:CRISPR/Cas system-associated exonuclease Cas4 (RecB family)
MLDQLAKKIEEQLYAGFARSVNKPDPWYESGIHISDLIYDCLRRAYYGKVVGPIFDMDSIFRMAIGAAVHSISLGGKQELRVEWEGVRGSIDEYLDGIIIEKKTSRSTPRSPNDHHVKQVEGYAWLLERNNYPVIAGVLCYVNVDSTEIAVFPVEMRSIDEIEKEMLAKRDILAKALADKTPPPRTVGWVCRYCPYVAQCFQEGMR